MTKALLVTIIVVPSVLLLAIIYMFLNMKFARIIEKLFFAPHMKTREERKLENVKHGYFTLEQGDGLKRTPITFTLSDGYVIHGDYILNDPTKLILLAHGHASNREGVIKYAMLFNELGYSMIIYDHRACGDNVKCMNTMGYQEHKDLVEIISQVKEQYKEAKLFGLFGVSMGAACSLMSLKYQQIVDFVISDCAFSSLRSQVVNTFHYVHLPAWPFSWYVNKYFRKKYGFSYKEVRPYDNVRENKVPLLIIHGTKDEIVNFKNAQIIYDNNLGYKEFFPFYRAKHGKSLDTDRLKYKSVIINFVDKIK